MPIRSSSEANKVYKFVHRTDEYILTTIQGISYRHPEGWIEILEDGRIVLNASCFNGYAWDGCTPKWIILDLIFGTPDGKLDFFTEKPITYYASFVHDLFYQYKEDVPLSRSTVDKLFGIILRQSGFKWWFVYSTFVKLFGGFFGKWKSKEKTNNIRIVESSWIKRAYEDLRKVDLPKIEKHPFMKLGKNYSKNDETTLTRQ